jgi:hypothetical protein
MGLIVGVLAPLPLTEETLLAEVRVDFESTPVSPRTWQGKAATPSFSSDAMSHDSWKFHIEQGLDIKAEFRKGKLTSMARDVPLCCMRWIWKIGEEIREVRSKGQF